MSATIETDQELKEEAFAILSQHLSPHKIARLLSVWQIGKGDYVMDRDALFSNETVESLFEQAQASHSKS
ncbi:MAG: hypothetical protein ABIT37_02915 [Luteolibacter sp.]